VAGDADRLRQFSDTEAYFFQGGKPLVEGSRLTNLEYADVMRRMADEGARVIYSGDIAKRLWILFEVQK
jgi:gamma-glutamyltranspeptidase/glutathione hydrolase